MFSGKGGYVNKLLARTNIKPAPVDLSWTWPKKTMASTLPKVWLACIGTGYALRHGQSETGRRQSPPTSRCFHPPSSRCRAASTNQTCPGILHHSKNHAYTPKPMIRSACPTSFELPSQRRTSTAIPKSTRPKVVCPTNQMPKRPKHQHAPTMSPRYAKTHILIFLYFSWDCFWVHGKEHHFGPGFSIWLSFCADFIH